MSTGKKVIRKGSPIRKDRPQEAVFQTTTMLDKKTIEDLKVSVAAMEKLVDDNDESVSEYMNKTKENQVEIEALKEQLAEVVQANSILNLNNSNLLDRIENLEALVEKLIQQTTTVESEVKQNPTAVIVNTLTPEEYENYNRLKNIPPNRKLDHIKKSKAYEPIKKDINKYKTLLNKAEKKDKEEPIRLTNPRLIQQRLDNERLLYKALLKREDFITTALNGGDSVNNLTTDEETLAQSKTESESENSDSEATVEEIETKVATPPRSRFSAVSDGPVISKKSGKANIRKK